MPSQAVARSLRRPFVEGDMFGTGLRAETCECLFPYDERNHCARMHDFHAVYGRCERLLNHGATFSKRTYFKECGEAMVGIAPNSA